MIEIPLSQGQLALIDDEDFALVSTFKWFADKRGKRAAYYASRSIMQNRKTTKIYMHRLIVGANERTVDVDHVDGNGLNNQKSNLRRCTRSQNSGNSLARGGSSKFKGVSFHKSAGGMWVAQLGTSGKCRYLGIFRTEEEAAIAYNLAAVAHFGEFATLNQFEKQGAV